MTRVRVVYKSGRVEVLFFKRPRDAKAARDRARALDTVQTANMEAAQ